jgi:hypothetical protein
MHDTVCCLAIGIPPVPTVQAQRIVQQHVLEHHFETASLSTPFADIIWTQGNEHWRFFSLSNEASCCQMSASCLLAHLFRVH